MREGLEFGHREVQIPANLAEPRSFLSGVGGISTKIHPPHASQAGVYRKEGIVVYLVLQHPFADMRGFLGSESGRLSRPNWPNALPKSDFVRSSGLVKSRPRGGVDEWAGEEVFSDAARALRFPDQLGHTQLKAGAITAYIERTFRRFHSEGTVAHLDVGFRLSLEPRTSAASAKEWVMLLRKVLEIPVRIKDATRQTQTVKLIESGKVLAQHYLEATTSRKLNPEVSLQPWWFCPGIPALIVEFSRSDPMVLPPHTRHVLDIPEADAILSHAWFEIGKQRCSVWFVAIGKGDTDAVRRLRIHLSRLHTERECLRLVIFHLSDERKFSLDKNPSRSDAVQLYLNDTLRVIQKPERFGFSQSVMFSAAQQALDIAFEGQGTSLRNMRRQVAAKVRGYILRAQATSTVINNIQGDLMNTNIQLGPVTVSGDFTLVTATNIQNSFNKVANADVDAELKEKLKLMTVEVANLVQKLTPDDAEKVSKDLGTLTAEAVSKNPRKEWYELSAQGIVEAAKTVAEMAGPVTTAVKAVLALLAL